MARIDFTEEELIQLLITSRNHNKEKNITGMLLYLQGKFMQILEGNKINVDNIYTKIKQDQRHSRIATVIQGNSPDRIFSGWTMGFKN